MSDDDLAQEKNADAFAELSFCLDNKSLTLMFRDAKDEGRKALKIRRKHNLSSSDTRVIALYTELTSLKEDDSEDLKDYMLRAETAASMLKKAGEVVSDSLVIAMMLKGLPSELKSFVTVTTQGRKPHTLSSFKQALRTHEETMKAYEKETDGDNVMLVKNQKIKCYGCGKIGHKKSEYRNPITCLRSSNGKQGQKRWCSVCRTKTHYTYQCREKTNED